MSDTLVLNKSYYAVHIVDWKRAISLLYQGHADVLDENFATYSFEDWRELSAAMESYPSGFVNTVAFQIAIPEVIRLTRYDRLPKAEVKFTRRNIYQHYKHQCCYCGQTFGTNELNLDHIVPRSKGGKTDWSNIVTACIPCNTKKMDRTPEQAGMKLLVKPAKPAWKGSKSLLGFSTPLRVKTMWQKVIDTRYWESELEK